jgi:hypothetical protein
LPHDYPPTSLHSKLDGMAQSHPGQAAAPPSAMYGVNTLEDVDTKHHVAWTTQAAADPRRGLWIKEKRGVIITAGPTGVRRPHRLRAGPPGLPSALQRPVRTRPADCCREQSWRGGRPLSEAAGTTRQSSGVDPGRLGTRYPVGRRAARILFKISGWPV